MSDIYNSPEKTYDIVNSEIKDKVVANTVTTLISSSIAADNTQFNEKIVQYSYDNFNQLTEAKNDSGTILKNTYNGEGLRVSKEQGAQKTNLLYEGNQVVLEVDGATGTEKAINVYGNNLISRKSRTTTAYYMYNGHGDVTNLLDGKGGIIGSYYYDAFGNVQENTSTFSNPYRYAGYQYDEEIGKYYLLNRMYDPESARFMQEDTYRGNANDPLSLNLYTYVNNNPMIYDDQNGHWPSFIDNFVSGVKSVVSSAISYAKETVINAYNTVSSTLSYGVSYLATSVGKAVTSTINKGKKIVNTATSVSKAISIVYNKVIKPKVERDDQQRLQDLKTGISVKAGEVADYVKGLDMQKLAFGGMSMVVGGVGAVAGSLAMAAPGGQVVGAALIGLGITTVAFGAGEVRETLSGVNPGKNLLMDKLKISESDYYFVGGVIEAGSGLLTGNLAALALAGSIMDLSEEGTALATSGGGSIRNNRAYSFKKGSSSRSNKQELSKREADAEKILGKNGTQFESKTTWQNGKTERIDVENPSPGERPGQIHYHEPDNTKWYFDIEEKQFYNQKTGELAPNKIQKLLKDKDVIDAINKGLKFLGEDKLK